MSRKSKKNRNRKSKKEHGGPKIGKCESHGLSEASGRIAKRKRCRSNKKLLRKIGRAKKLCCICINTETGARRIIDCGHIFHKECIKKWLKEQASNCPTCRRDIPKNTGRHRRTNPEIRRDSPTNHRPFSYIIPRQSFDSMDRQQQVMQEFEESIGVYPRSPYSDRDSYAPDNLDNLNIDSDNASRNFDNLNDNAFNLDNQSTDLDNASPNLNYRMMDTENRTFFAVNRPIGSDEESPDMDNSSIYLLDLWHNFNNSNDSFSNIPSRRLYNPFRNLALFGQMWLLRL